MVVSSVTKTKCVLKQRVLTALSLFDVHKICALFYLVVVIKYASCLTKALKLKRFKYLNDPALERGKCQAIFS